MVARWWFAALALALALLTGGAEAAAPREHRVAKGQTLGKIAKRYNVSIDALCRANDITPRTKIKPGQKLAIPPKDDVDGERTRALREKQRASSADKGSPDKSSSSKAPPTKAPPNKAKAGEVVWHTVAKGQRLGTIARRYGSSVEAIQHANDLGPKEHIRPGQKLIIPSADDESGERARAIWEARRGEPPAEEEPAAAKSDDAPSWAAYVRKPARPGYLTIIGRQKSWKGTAIGKSGRPLKRARQAIMEVLATADGSEHEIEPRLIELLARVSDTFGGRPIRVVSGYRLGETSRTSRHRHGKAIDFTIAGVPNAALRDFVKSFDKVGVGYYPNSSFVHLDVREQWTFWIDYSGPGQRPRYGGFWTKRSK